MKQSIAIRLATAASAATAGAIGLLSAATLSFAADRVASSQPAKPSYRSIAGPMAAVATYPAPGKPGDIRVTTVAFVTSPGATKACPVPPRRLRIHRGPWLELTLAYHDEVGPELKRWLSAPAYLWEMNKSNFRMLKDLAAGTELALGALAGQRRPDQVHYVAYLVRDDCKFQHVVHTRAEQAQRRVDFPLAFRAGDVLDRKSLNDRFAGLVFAFLAHESTHLVQHHPFGVQSTALPEGSDRFQIPEIPGTHNSARKEAGADFVEYCLRMALLPRPWSEELIARLWRDRRDWYLAVRERLSDPRLIAIEDKLFSAVQHFAGHDFLGPQGEDNLPKLMPACAASLRLPDEDISTLQPNELDKATAQKVLTGLRKISKPMYWKSQQYDDTSLDEMPQQHRADLLKGTRFESATEAAPPKPADGSASGLR
jgi:hypothetical protein